MARTKYAYFVTVSGKKRCGGTVTAASMDEAAKAAARICKLEMRVTRYALHSQYDWMLNGKRAFLAVWVPPEKYREDFAVSER